VQKKKKKEVTIQQIPQARIEPAAYIQIRAPFDSKQVRTTATGLIPTTLTTDYVKESASKCWKSTGAKKKKELE
jgi:hypothetical protein